jgi:hypothetical protein
MQKAAVEVGQTGETVQQMEKTSAWAWKQHKRTIW